MTKEFVRKIDLLKLIQDEFGDMWFNSHDYDRIVDYRRDTQLMQLLRLHRSEILRRSGERGRYRYQLTNRGRWYINKHTGGNANI